MDFVRPGDKRFIEKYEPLLEEFWQLRSTISIDESLENEKPLEKSHKKSLKKWLIKSRMAFKSGTGSPLCFKDIQHNFENAKYTGLSQVLTDMRKITRKIGESHTEGTLLNNFANEVDLYIERTIVPVLHADGISKLYDTRTKTGERIHIKLDEHRALARDQVLSFDEDLTRVGRLKMCLRWPLPAIKADIDFSLKATANLSKTGGNKTGNTSKSEEKGASSNLSTISEETGQPKAASTHKRSTFKIGDSKFKVGVTSFDALPKFNILITESNQINRDIFAKTYVERFMQKAKLDEVLYIPLATAQVCAPLVGKESQVETMLVASLYNVISPLVLNSLDEKKEYFEERFRKIIKKRPYLEHASLLNKAELTSIFQNDKSGALFFGIQLFPDLEIGYFTLFGTSGMGSKSLPVIYTSIGEVKYVTFNIETCINDLKSSDQWNRRRETTEENERRLRIKEVEDTLYKYTSAAVRFGVTRYVLCDYLGFLLVKLSYEKEDPRAGYGTLLSPPRGYDPPQYIKSEYSYFSSQEPYIRLYVASFLSLNHKFIKEMKQFRKLVFEEWKEVQDEAKRGQADEIMREESSGGHANQEGGNQPAGLEGGAPDQFSLSSTTRFSTMKTIGPLPLSDSIFRTSTGVCNEFSASNEKYAQFNESVQFEEKFFKRPSYIEIGSIIKEIIAMGDRLAQVVVIDLHKFANLVPQNLLKRDRLPQNCILKVFDPYLGRLLTWDASQFEYATTRFSYQTAMDYCSKEVRAYCALSEYWGTVLPKMYGYGRLSDLSACTSDLLYLHLCGGYIMLEYLEEDENFVITEDFFRTIIQLYRSIHQKDIIQNDIKARNAIITTSGEFKIIDFSHCRFNATDLEKKEEIDLVYQHFGRAEWR